MKVLNASGHGLVAKARISLSSLSNSLHSVPGAVAPSSPSSGWVCLTSFLPCLSAFIARSVGGPAGAEGENLQAHSIVKGLGRDCTGIVHWLRMWGLGLRVHIYTCGQESSAYRKFEDTGDCRQHQRS